MKAISDERDPTFDVPGPWVCPGHKTWHGDNIMCKSYSVSTGGTCGICMNACPWNKPAGLIHKAVKATVKKTTSFNTLFVTADKLFGYGKPLDPERWWEMDLPSYGVHTRR